MPECPGHDCWFCNGRACNQCPSPSPDRPCTHAVDERHEPIQNRVPTEKNPPLLVGSIDVDLAVDGEAREAAAKFADLLARIMRSKKRIRVTIESID